MPSLGASPSLEPLLTVRIPGPVVGKGRPRFVRSTGRAYTPGKTLTAENRIAFELAQAWGDAPPCDAPLSLRVMVEVDVPASKSKKFRAAALAGAELPVGKPDLDNVLKLIGDSGNGVIWRDDSRIAEIHMQRRYAESACLTITVERAA